MIEIIRPVDLSGLATEKDYLILLSEALELARTRWAWPAIEFQNLAQFFCEQFPPKSSDLLVTFLKEQAGTDENALANYIVWYIKQFPGTWR